MTSSFKPANGSGRQDLRVRGRARARSLPSLPDRVRLERGRIATRADVSRRICCRATPRPAQLGRARPGIVLSLMESGAERFLGDGLVNALAPTGAERGFHQPVLAGVEADDRCRAA